MTDLQAYRGFWHPVARDIDIVPDRPTRLRLLGENLVAFRTEHGISVFKDLCIHRGTALSLGRVEDGTIECPYHGWRYDATGRCVRIPALRPGAPIPGKARAIAYRVREYAGLVFVAMEEPRAPFPEFREDYADDDPSLRLTFIASYDWAVDAGRAVENFLDVAHFPFIHENTLAARDDTLVHDHHVSEDEYSLSFTYVQVEPADPMNGQAGAAVSLDYYYRAPFTVHLKRTSEASPNFMVASLWSCPIEAGASTLFTTVRRNFDVEPEHDARFHAFADLVMREDQEVVESVKPEEIPVDLREELHIKVPDAAGLRLRRILDRIGRGELAAA